MEKIKKVFSPGSKKDDEVMYGDPETRRQESLSNTSGQEPPKLYPVDGASGQKESGGVLGQITNPGGNKYDEQRYGTTATSNPDPNKLHTDPSAKKDHSVMNQILNPGGHKYDEQRFGDTATTAGTGTTQGTGGVGEKLYPEHGVEENPTHYPGLGNAGAAGGVGPNTRLETDSNQKDHTVLRQVLNPSGNKRDEVAYGTTAHAARDQGIYDANSSDRLGGGGIAAAGASSTLTDRTVPSSSTTGGNRETSVAGVYSGRGDPVIVGTAASTTPQYNEPQSHVLDRSHPLRDGSGSAPVHINPVGAPGANINQHAAQTESIGLSNVSDGSRTADNHINPIGAPSTANATLPAATSATAAGGLATSGLATSSQTQDHSTLGATTGGAVYTDHHGVERLHEGYPKGTKLDCDGKPIEGYVHHLDGPHSLDMANALDPNVTASPKSPSSSTFAGSNVASPSPSSSRVTSGAAAGGAAGGGRFSESSLEKDRSTSHTSDDHEKKEKTGLLQKILHPKSHKEEKNTTTSSSSHGHEHPSTAVDGHGHNVLHKDPPAH